MLYPHSLDSRANPPDLIANHKADTVDTMRERPRQRQVERKRQIKIKFYSYPLDFRANLPDLVANLRADTVDTGRKRQRKRERGR